MATIFTKIIQGEIPCYKIAENESFIAFLDISPIQKGHALVVPKIEEDYIFNLPPALLEQMLPFAQRVASAIERVVACKRIAIAVLGLEVPHAHMHLIPIQKEGDLSFSNPRVELSKEEFEQLAARIAAEFNG